MSYPYNNNNGGFTNGPQYSGYGNNRPPVQAQYNSQPKRSKCRQGFMKDGRIWVSGAKGIGTTEYFRFIANPGKNDGKCKGENGARWVSMIANCTNGKQEWTVNCLWDLQKKKLVFKSLGLIANPSAPNGGYFGIGGRPVKINNNR